MPTVWMTSVSASVCVCVHSVCAFRKTVCVGKCVYLHFVTRVCDLMCLLHEATK